MTRNMIPVSLLFYTTTACTKSDEQIIEDFCEQYTCTGDADDQYLIESISDCKADGDGYFQDFDTCSDEARRYFICVGNLSCSDFLTFDNEGRDSVCKEEYKAWNEC